MGARREPIAQSESDVLEQSLTQTPLFSIIIPVRNEEKHIATCLDSLRRLQCLPDLFEVIVVDNGSTDSTRSIAARFQDALPLRILEKPQAYISAVRNAGAAIAAGQFLAFLDADCEVLPDWLSAAHCVIAAGHAGVFGSFYLIPEKSSWIARYWYDERDKKGSGEVSYLPAGDLFVSRGLFQKLQGFDESIQTNEDYEFCQRVRAAGFPIACVPALGVIHWGTPQSLGEFFRKHRWHGMHVFRVFLRNLPALFNFKPIALALYTLACLLGLLAGVGVALWAGQFRLFTGFLLALMAPPLGLGIRAAISSRRSVAALPLSALYLTYAIARASCLIDWRTWSASTAKG